MMRATKLISTAGGCLALSAALLTAGCRTATSEPAMSRTTADKPAADKVDVSNVTALELLDTASAEMGGPKTYTLTLITSADKLPQAVTEQGLDVDFDTQDVVLVGMGEQPSSGFGVEITGTQQVGSTLFVQASFTHPAPDDIVNTVITQPWAAATIDKRDGQVTLRSDFK